MTIGIIGAMEQEIALLKSDMNIIKKSEIAGRIFYEGTLYGINIILVLSRIGKVAAANTTATLILKFNPKIIIFTGVAGAVEPSVNIGDIVLSNNMAQHDLDASPIYPRYEVPILGITNFRVPKLISDMTRKAIKEFLENDITDDFKANIMKAFGISTPILHVGTIVSGDQFVKDSSTTKRIKQDFAEAKCVEMEGAAVAQVCKEFNIPFLVIRVISDKADHSAEIDFIKFLDMASHYSRGILKRLLPAIHDDQYINKAKWLTLDSKPCKQI